MLLKDGFENNLNAETVLSSELIAMHEEEEEELFFEDCHRERTIYTRSPLDKVAHAVLTVLMISPK